MSETKIKAPAYRCTQCGAEKEMDKNYRGVWDEKKRKLDDFCSEDCLEKWRAEP